MTTRILVLFYSQSGEVNRAVHSLVKFLDTPEVEIKWECIKPTVDYPYPWSFNTFFGVFPECVNGEVPEIQPPSFSQNEKFDLVIIAYQVWFLSPSLPIQGFLKSQYAQVLKDTKVMTLIVCRSMWHSASRIMKKMIFDVGGVHIDNIVVRHQGSQWSTVISTPVSMLTGKKDKLLKRFPTVGVSDADIDTLAEFGKVIASNIPGLKNNYNQPLLKGLGAVEVDRNYIIPELITRFIFEIWAKVIRFFGKSGNNIRQLVTYLFVVNLVLTIFILFPIGIVFYKLSYPMLKKRIEAYIYRLKLPSGVDGIGFLKAEA